jgi:tRNA-specific 2-thiouridylase
MEKIILGMSGGVDSSIAAWLLKQQGYEVQGLFMKNWEEDDTDNYCSAAEDLRDAQAVCDTLGITLHTVNFATEYWNNVFAYCLQEFQAGRTPNPDIWCNREIKFKVFLEHALRLGGTAIATGHYVRLRQVEGTWQLLKGLDSNKDQSYFLATLDQAQLAYSRFPMGDWQKTAVRELAARLNLATFAKKGSTGICFIGERPFKAFLSRFLPAQPGAIETPTGRYLGQHDGLMYYTIGQRQGLQIGGQLDGNGQPWYVAAKDVAHNRLLVVQGHDHPLLFSQRLMASQVHWITGTAPNLPYACQAKTRYRQSDQACVITTLDHNSCEVTFQQPQWAVTPGQAIVFYQQEQCLGSAIIDRSF